MSIKNIKNNYNNLTNPIITNEGMYLIVILIEKFLIPIDSLAI